MCNQQHASYEGPDLGACPLKHVQRHLKAPVHGILNSMQPTVQFLVLLLAIILEACAKRTPS